MRGPDGALRSEVLVADTCEFKSLWHEAVEALAGAIDLLRHPQEFGAISYQYLPYAAILPVFAALQAEARRLPPAQKLDARRKTRLWYWSSVFTIRYSGAVESTSARDCVSGNIPQHGDLDDNHILPKSLGSKYALNTSIDTILNRTPLTSETNREVIKDRLPNAYLPELIAANGEDEARSILGSHFISPRAFAILMSDPFTPSDFEEFIEERGNTFRNRIEDLAGQGELAPSSTDPPA